MRNAELLIKDVTGEQGPSSLALEIPCYLTVLQLKERIRDLYPSKPEPSSQRLILAGRVLRTAQVLADVLPKQSEPVNIYLVVAPMKTTTNTASAPLSSSTVTTTSGTAPAAGRGRMTSAEVPVVEASGAGSSSTAARSTVGAETAAVRSRHGTAGEASGSSRAQTADAANVGGQAEPAAPAVPRFNLEPILAFVRTNWLFLAKVALMFSLASLSSDLYVAYVLVGLAILLHLHNNGVLRNVARRLKEIMPTSLLSRLTIADGSATVKLPLSPPRTARESIIYYTLLVGSFVFGFVYSMHPDWRPVLILPPANQRSMASPSTAAAPAENHPHAD